MFLAWAFTSALDSQPHETTVLVSLAMPRTRNPFLIKSTETVVRIRGHVGHNGLVDWSYLGRKEGKGGRKLKYPQRKAGRKGAPEWMQIPSNAARATTEMKVLDWDKLY